MDDLIDDIRFLCEEQYASHAEFAAALRISPKHLSQIFNGHANASYSLLDRMFAALNVRPVLEPR